MIRRHRRYRPLSSCSDTLNNTACTLIVLSQALLIAAALADLLYRKIPDLLSDPVIEGKLSSTMPIGFRYGLMR
ncbi:MAG: hypothetical protein CNF01_07750 [Halieaceae bacterium MED-G27]|nr:MAG: hypothetical protein CNF01_07750 [Halieaceae bacterium MED-G27]